MHNKKRQTKLSDETRKDYKNAVGKRENLNNIRERGSSDRVEGSLLLTEVP